MPVSCKQGRVLIRSAKVEGLRSRLRIRMLMRADAVVLRLIASAGAADEELLGTCIAAFLGEVEGRLFPI